MESQTYHSLSLDWYKASIMITIMRGLLQQESFRVCAQPMGDDVTMYCLPLAGCIHKMIPATVTLLLQNTGQMASLHKGTAMQSFEIIFTWINDERVHSNLIASQDPQVLTPHTNHQFWILKLNTLRPTDTYMNQ